MKFLEYDNYNPPTYNEKIPLSPTVAGYMNFHKYDGQSCTGTNNIEKTDLLDATTWLDYELKNDQNLINYVKENNLDCRNLSPKQAIGLSNYLVMKRVDYDYLSMMITKVTDCDAINYPDSLGALGKNYFLQDEDAIVRYESELTKDQLRKLKNNPVSVLKQHIEMDNVSVIKLLDSLKSGVCRQYSEGTKLVLEALKGLQTSDDNKLLNTYCRQTETAIRRNGNAVDYWGLHIWNAFCTVDKDQRIWLMSGDATGNDKKNLTSIESKVLTEHGTDKYWIAEIEGMQSSGLLTLDEKLALYEDFLSEKSAVLRKLQANGVTDYYNQIDYTIVIIQLMHGYEDLGDQAKAKKYSDIFEAIKQANEKQS